MESSLKVQHLEVKKDMHIQRQRKACGDHEKGEVAGDGSDGVQKPDVVGLHRPCD